VLGPTYPNRLYWMTGTIAPGGAHGGPVIHDSIPASGLRWRTYPERLDAAGVDWRVYQEEDNFECNMLEYFARFQDAPKHSSLYKRGLKVQPAGQFEYDALHDRLPAVSWIIPTSAQCEHPDYLPAAGADFVASKIAAVAANPDVWKKTVVILNYDENDGLFDHVPPPVPPAGTPSEFVGGLPVGAGFRVPCIVVSPWTAGGWVASEPFDHTSVLRFLETFTGIRETNISAWRRATFGDLTSVFRFGQAPRTPPPLPPTRGRLAQAQQEVATLPPPVLPPDPQVMPTQE
jgi:phospholipase C